MTKNMYLGTTALTVAVPLVAVVFLFGLPKATQLSADPSLGIHIGFLTPPPLREDPRWVSPDQSAVWIGGHNEWSTDHYVWLGGYYAYPPNKNDKWVESRYSHTEDGYFYHPGHWSHSSGTTLSKGIDSPSTTMIHPVLQDNGAGNGEKDVKTN